MMIYLTPKVSRAKSKWYRPKKVEKWALNSQLLTVQILKTIFKCLSYFVTTVHTSEQHLIVSIEINYFFSKSSLSQIILKKEMIQLTQGFHFFC